MRTSLIGTVFLFTCIFGQNSTGKQGNVQLLANSMPCSTSEECRAKLGRFSLCKDNSCMCPIQKQWRDCPLDAFVNARRFNDDDDVTLDSYIGYPCTADDGCKVNHAYCKKIRDSTKGTCECEKGFIHSRDLFSCYKIAERLRDLCFETRQCLINFKNSTCSRARRCECQDHYHEANGKCWKSVGYEETCGHNHECWNMRGICNEKSKTCVCDINHIIDSDKVACQQLSGIDDPCFQDIECALYNLQHSECILGSCICKVGYHYVESVKNCVTVNKSSSLIALCPTSLILVILFLFLL